MNKLFTARDSTEQCSIRRHLLDAPSLFLNALSALDALRLCRTTYLGFKSNVCQAIKPCLDKHDNSQTCPTTSRRMPSGSMSNKGCLQSALQHFSTSWLLQKELGQSAAVPSDAHWLATMG